MQKATWAPSVLSEPAPPRVQAARVGGPCARPEPSDRSPCQWNGPRSYHASASGHVSRWRVIRGMEKPHLASAFNCLCLGEGRGAGVVGEFGMDTHTLLCLKWGANRPGEKHTELPSGWCGSLDGRRV